MKPVLRGVPGISGMARNQHVRYRFRVVAQSVLKFEINAYIRIVSAYRNLCDCTSVLLFTNGVVRRDFRWPSFGRKWVALANEEAPAKRKQEREAVDKGATGCHSITIR